jgi:hypothetical protein
MSASHEFKTVLERPWALVYSHQGGEARAPRADVRGISIREGWRRLPRLRGSPRTHPRERPARQVVLHVRQDEALSVRGNCPLL